MTTKKEENNNSKKNSIILRGWVKFCLSLKGHTFRSFAQECNVTPGSLGIVFVRPYPRMEKLIADALETRPQDLWSERYGPDGRPNRQNTWYLRKSGGWKPKNIKNSLKIKKKVSEGNNHGKEVENGTLETRNSDGCDPGC